MTTSQNNTLWAYLMSVTDFVMANVATLTNLSMQMATRILKAIWVLIILTLAAVLYLLVCGFIVILNIVIICVIGVYKVVSVVMDIIVCLAMIGRYVFNHINEPARHIWSAIRYILTLPQAFWQIGRKIFSQNQKPSTTRGSELSQTEDILTSTIRGFENTGKYVWRIVIALIHHHIRITRYVLIAIHSSIWYFVFFIREAVHKGWSLILRWFKVEKSHTVWVGPDEVQRESSIVTDQNISTALESLATDLDEIVADERTRVSDTTNTTDSASTSDSQTYEDGFNSNIEKVLDTTHAAVKNLKRTLGRKEDP